VIIVVVLLVTGGAGYQIKKNLYFEGDITKFLPGNLKAVKANDYSQKNFNYQERVLIGVDYAAGSVLEPVVLRNIEKIVLGLKELKVEKTFESRLTGKTETLLLPIGIDTDNINSLANLEDTILDQNTGSIIAGSVIEKLKNDHGIRSEKGQEERLPQADSDLAKIIPDLRARVKADRIFNGNILSGDEHAANIQVPMIRKWDYKERFALLELETALDPQRLKNRFLGNDSTFPFTVFGRTVDGITLDDAFLATHSKKVGAGLKRFLVSQLEPAFDSYPKLKKALDGSVSPEKLREIIRTTKDRDFFLNSEIQGWDHFINNLYEFTLGVIDPLSRENLEFKFFDVKDIYNLKVNYELILELVKQYDMSGLSIHIAGQPVTISLISYMMRADMKRMVPIAVGVIFMVLLISFRNIAGLIIPLLTVVITVIWTLALMAIAGIPLSISTTTMPIVLLAVGTAYGIHLLNRYFTDIHATEDRALVITHTFKQIGPAVIMAAATTIAGFGSLNFSSLINIRHFGLFSASGVAIALVLSFTLTPAILMLTRSGTRGKKGAAPAQAADPGTGWPVFVVRHPWLILSVFCLVTAFAIFGTAKNHFEGDPIINFKTDNPLFQADQFLNQSLTGTNMISLMFRFRDGIRLDEKQAILALRNRVDGFAGAWQTFLAASPDVRDRALDAIGSDLKALAAADPPDPSLVESRLVLMRDLLNESFTIEATRSLKTPEPSPTTKPGDEASLEDLATGTSDLESVSSELDDLGEKDTGVPSDQLAGLNDLVSRLGAAESDRTAIRQKIIRLRALKTGPAGLTLQRAFNQLQDLFAVDVKQPIVLHKLETLYGFLKTMEQPVVIKGGREMKPTGLVVSPVDLVRKVYKTFYHDDNRQFDRLPDTDRDGFEDITLTDRSIIAVAINQAQNSNRDMFDSMVTPDHKEFQMQIMIRSGRSKVIADYVQAVKAELETLFPENDPYIDRVLIGGMAPQLLEVTSLLMDSQLKSIAGSFILVWIVTFFIFRSVMGGLFSLIPLGFTVILNFGLMYAVGWPITQGTVMIASITIGIGVDYTIHFLERFKRQLQQGETLDVAYVNTIRTSGKAIFINALSVALGFMVLVFSDFIPVISMGVLMMGTMIFSTIGALIILPVLIFIIQPKFITRQNGDEALIPVKP